jgi:O-antigen/teichoic acid export membrane protein
LWVIYYRIDTTMLAGFRSMSEVGLYNGAYKIMEGLIMIAAVIMMVSFPRMSRLGKEKGPEFYSFINKLLIVLISLSFLVKAIMYFVAAYVFQLILGDQYYESIGIFKILLVAVLAIYPGYLVTQALIALDLHKVYMYMALMGALLNICLNFLLIPQYGAAGAAWATVFTEISLTAACGTFIWGYYQKRQVA